MLKISFLHIATYKKLAKLFVYIAIFKKLANIFLYIAIFKKLKKKNDVTKSASRSNQSTPTQSGGLWECSVCGRGFNRNWHLKRHLATHLAVKPYSCPYCPHASNIKANLSLHIRKMHQDKRLA
ncbi:Cell wall integrity transcriptional regulator CAS5 [Armadillidium vulgare]|nr:Cell wall integrity transcriptional regulator CAS5 [Armadillidium vulgare]